MRQNSQRPYRWRRRSTLLLAALAGLIAGCDGPISAPAGEPAATQMRPTDFWLGRWVGVEGNYLDIAPKGEKYRVTIQELDGVGTYDGVGEGAAIRFTRRGAEERLTPGDGAATGLKYLADKDTCLIVKEGEGFCR